MNDYDFRNANRSYDELKLDDWSKLQEHNVKDCETYMDDI